MLCPDVTWETFELVTELLFVEPYASNQWRTTIVRPDSLLFFHDLDWAAVCLFESVPHIYGTESRNSLACSLVLCIQSFILWCLSACPRPPKKWNTKNPGTGLLFSISYFSWEFIVVFFFNCVFLNYRFSKYVWMWMMFEEVVRDMDTSQLVHFLHLKTCRFTLKTKKTTCLRVW